MDESASFDVYIVKIHPSIFAVGDDKKRKGKETKERKVTQSHKWVIF